MSSHDVTHAELLQLYEEVDREVAAERPRCDASGRCCRFAEYGHTLFLTQFEADLLVARAPAYAAPVTRDFCPFQVGNLCTAREPRPLGCRIYFCDPAYQERSHQITEKYLGILRQLAQDRGLPWRYAPLHQFLNEAAANPPAEPPAPVEATGRVALPVID